MISYNLKNLKQLEFLGYNLQCYERPTAMIYESYRKYSMYYILLFRELQSMYFKSDLMNFASVKTQITSKIVKVNKNNIKNYIKLNMELDNKMLFYADHFWNMEYSGYYGVKHYKHPLLLKEYENNVIVIDEDITTINKGLNKYYIWPYSEKSLGVKFFEKICGQWKINELEEGYIVREFSTDNREPVNLENVVNDYKDIINIINDTFLSEEKVFIDTFEEAILDKHTKYITDQGRKYIYEHIKAINRQFRLFSYLLNNGSEYKIILDDVGNTLKELYEKYYFMLTKQMINKENDIMVYRLKDLYVVENKFYKLIKRIVEDENFIIKLLMDYLTISYE